VTTSFDGARPFLAWQHCVSAVAALSVATLVDAARSPTWRRGLLLLLLPSLERGSPALRCDKACRKPAGRLATTVYFLSALPLLPSRHLLFLRNAGGCVSSVMPCCPRPRGTVTAHVVAVCPPAIIGWLSQRPTVGAGLGNPHLGRCWPGLGMYNVEPLPGQWGAVRAIIYPIIAQGQTSTRSPWGRPAGGNSPLTSLCPGSGKPSMFL
jgi:hypothetical protein